MIERADYVVRIFALGVLVAFLIVTLAIWWSMRYASLGLIAVMLTLLSEESKAEILRGLEEE